MIHVTRPEIFHDAISSCGDRRDLDDGYLHFNLIVSEDFSERILSVTNVRRNFAFDDDFRVRGDHEFVAPRG